MGKERDARGGRYRLGCSPARERRQRHIRVVSHKLYRSVYTDNLSINHYVLPSQAIRIRSEQRHGSSHVNASRWKTD